MTPNSLYRLWKVISKNPISTDLLSSAFENLHVEIEDYNRFYVLTPSEWLLASDLQILLEQDGYSKTTIVRGPIFDGISNIDIMRQIMDEIYEHGTHQFPESLLYTYEMIAQDITPKYNALILETIMNDGELLSTLNIFCQENMSAKNAATKLFIHRNTLLYRLDKIAKVTGFDTKSHLELTNLYYAIKKTPSSH